ncbi:1,4-alpha-glucan branching protein GlgB [Nigerium massiliense]|uniref:1,4-alpha-glucan branching protein GlgB n=1 Tax=Nigerium massiliense TaxID=1522317 RepID=UPI0009E47612|nr:1,4-alpha-glucan branching protein GlgB [Nigerium massiliense]
MANDIHGGLTGWDLEGFHSGGDTEVWRRLGSHVVTIHDDERGEVTGTRFAVWAPNAQAVRVNADFNWWTGDAMTLVPGSGVWATFIEGVGEGTLYKYNILGADGVWREKVDPMARFAEQAPANSSIVYESKYVWSDDEWLAQRALKTHHQSAMSIYEVHLGGWRKGKTYLDLADELVDYVKWQGYTHVEFMPVAEHPFVPSWGYQVTNYFAPQSRLGRPDEFRYLIERLHKAGIGVILDWVPGHFPKDEWALGFFDGTHLYEHADPRQGEQRDWGTYVFNFGRNEVKSFLVSNALYWIKEFHIDALRVDAVASMLYLDYSREPGQWVPNRYGGNENLEAIDLLRYVNKHLYEREPGVIMIAEESTSFPGITRPTNFGGLGFGFKWNMGWMNDTLRYLALEPIHRQYHHNEMTFAMVYQYTENFILPISHDEVVHGKGSMINKIPQDDWRKFATLRAFYSYMWSFPGKMLLFMGQEFGQRSEFNEEASLEWWVTDLWGHHGLQRMIKDLNAIYKEHPALWRLDSDPKGFRWINADDAGANTFSWIRSDGEGQEIAVMVNFSSEAWNDYRIGLPHAGTWTEIFNSDATIYDGSGGTGNMGRIIATPDPHNGFDNSALVQVPPLGAVFFRYDPDTDTTKEETVSEDTSKAEGNSDLSEPTKDVDASDAAQPEKQQQQDKAVSGPGVVTNVDPE